MAEARGALEADGAIARYFAHVVAETLRPRLPAAARVLDFGDRRGRVGLHLEAAGATVVCAAGPTGREETTGRGDGASFQAAFAEVGDWARVGTRASALASALVPGAPLLVRLRRAPGQHVARVTHDLGPAFSWEGRVGLGLVVPAEARSAWAERHPQAFGFLCAMEGVFGSWPAFREAGREVLLLGRLRPHDRAIPHGEAA